MQTEVCIEEGRVQLRSLCLPYHRTFAEAMPKSSYAGGSSRPRSVLVLGGGGMALPRFLALTRKGVHVHVVEIDADVVAIAEDFFRGQSPQDDECESRLHVHVTDGCQFVREAARRRQRFEAVVVDVSSSATGPQPQRASAAACSSTRASRAAEVRRPVRRSQGFCYALHTRFCMHRVAP